MRSLVPILTIFAAAHIGTDAANAGDAHDIPLKLFGENVVGEYDGCRFALWQKNRDPDRDEFAYVFYAPIPDAVALPGWAKIGDTIYELERVDNPSDGGALDPIQVYRDSGGQVTIHMEILEQREIRSGISIDDADLTFVMADKFPFVSNVNGLHGCPDARSSGGKSGDPSKLEGAPVPLSNARDYETLSPVPKPIIEHIRGAMSLECNLDQVPQYASSYAISDAMTLWEVPCALYAKNAATVFFTTLSDNPDFFAPLLANGPPGLADNARFDILNAAVLPEEGAITSYSYDGPTSSCGIYEKHVLRAVEGEAIELMLLEYREKTECDGKITEPENFPLIYAPD